MKRFFKIIGVVILLVIGGYYGYTYYKKSSSMLGVVHENADSILKIGIHDIRETLFLDALSSPSYYLEAMPPSISEDAGEEEGNGIYLMPYNLLAYTVPDVAKTWFVTWHITDARQFNTFVASALKKEAVPTQNSEKGNYQFAVVKTKKVVLAWNAKQLVAAFSMEPSFEKARTVFTDVLVNDRTLKNGDHALLDALGSESSHLVYKTGKGTSTLNFEDGKAVFDGFWATNKNQVFPKEISLDTSLAEMSFSLYLDAAYRQSGLKNKIIEHLDDFSFFKNNAMEASQVVNYTNGSVSLSVLGRTLQKDTVITYDYDDNFEKVAQKTVEEREVPKIRVRLGTEEAGLKTYFKNVGAMSDAHIFEPFPFYQFYVKEQGSALFFDTFPEALKSEKSLDPNFFRCSINFKKLQQDLQISQTEQLFSLLENLRIRAWQAPKNKVRMAGYLNAKNLDVNILSQIYFGMTPTD